MQKVNLFIHKHMYNEFKPYELFEYHTLHKKNSKSMISFPEKPLQIKIKSIQT